MQRPPKSDFPVHPTFIFKLQLDFFCNDHNGVKKFWSSIVIYILEFTNSRSILYHKKSRKNTET